MKQFMDEDFPVTPRQLYEVALRAGLADERIRICDGMAVSYFPTFKTLAKSKSRMIIDVSVIEPVEFDELSAEDMGIQYRIGTPQRKEVEEWINKHSVTTK